MAAWRHRDARAGFEVVFPRREGPGYRLDGYSTAVEAGYAWGIRYTLLLDEGWRTRSAHVVGQSAKGAHELLLEGNGGSWLVDGAPAPELTGCLDVDLEASACTNALPVLRLGLDVGDSESAPAVYVRAPTLSVERLEQSYTRLEDEGDDRRRFDYVSPAFDFRAVLTYDRFGLVVDYPGIAVRSA
jgi:hypothetical protein